MNLFRILLGLMTVGIIIFTGIAGLNHGWNLLAVFFENIISLNWSGQFNYDFMCYLLLSALWIMWRHKFSINGILFGLIASVAGILFFAPYLIVASFSSGGDFRILLLGENRGE